MSQITEKLGSDFFLPFYVLTLITEKLSSNFPPLKTQGRKSMAVECTEGKVTL